MQISVKFFGPYKCISGLDKLAVDMTDGSTIEQLIATLNSKFENTAPSRKPILIVNEKILTHDQILKDGDEVIIFHLLGGG